MSKIKVELMLFQIDVGISILVQRIALFEADEMVFNLIELHPCISCTNIEIVIEMDSKLRDCLH